MNDVELDNTIMECFIENTGYKIDKVKNMKSHFFQEVRK